MNKTATEMQLVPVEKLIPYINNARTHNKEQITKLRSSLREFGFINPVIIDKKYNVIAGHGRIMAAKEEGINEVPCVLVDYLTEAQKKAYILADNRLAEDAGWDENLLKIELESLQDMDFDLELTGFDLDDIDSILNPETSGGAEDDEFNETSVETELKKPTITRIGDLWHLGRHILLCGDSTNPDSYEKLMGKQKANLVVTDPPYNVAYEGSAGKIKNDSMKDDAFYQFLLDAFSCMYEAMEDDASIYVFHSDTEGLNFRKAFKAAGFYLSECCIWEKQSLVLGRSPYQWQHEPCLFGWKQAGKHQWYSDRKQTTIWKFDRPTKSQNHPTMKPIPLIAYPIKNSSMSNCIVLDPFGGSGSTLIACEQTNRICRTIELDEKYCDVIVKRYIEQAGSSDGVAVIRGGESIRFDKLNATES